MVSAYKSTTNYWNNLHLQKKIIIYIKKGNLFDIFFCFLLNTAMLLSINLSKTIINHLYMVLMDFVHLYCPNRCFTFGSFIRISIMSQILHTSRTPIYIINISTSPSILLMRSQCCRHNCWNPCSAPHSLPMPPPYCVVAPPLTVHRYCSWAS